MKNNPTTVFPEPKMATIENLEMSVPSRDEALINPHG